MQNEQTTVRVCDAVCLRVCVCVLRVVRACIMQNIYYGLSKMCSCCIREASRDTCMCRKGRRRSSGAGNRVIFCLVTLA